MAQKDYQNAKQSFEKAINENPNVLSPYVQLANIALIDKDIDSAISYYHKIERKEPQNINVLMMLGVLYNRKGDLTNSKKILQKVS